MLNQYTCMGIEGSNPSGSASSLITFMKRKPEFGYGFFSSSSTSFEKAYWGASWALGHKTNQRGSLLLLICPNRDWYTYSFSLYAVAL